jgi:hypothetical protein
MTQILVLQWPGASEEDFEQLVNMENDLEDSLSDYSVVDGHDLGSNEMNIFIETNHPAEAFAEVRTILGTSPRWSDIRAAHRDSDGQTFTVLWPIGSTSFTIQ